MRFIYKTLKKRARHIVLIADIRERFSIIYQCLHEGPDCQHLFIKTMINQPDVCYSCMRELHLISNYKKVSLLIGKHNVQFK